MFVCNCFSISIQVHRKNRSTSLLSYGANNTEDTIMCNNNKHRNAAIPFFLVIAISLFMSLQRSFLCDMYHNTLKYGSSLLYATNIRRRYAKIPIGYCFVYL